MPVRCIRRSLATAPRRKSAAAAALLAERRKSREARRRREKQQSPSVLRNVKAMVRAKRKSICDKLFGPIDDYNRKHKFCCKLFLAIVQLTSALFVTLHGVLSVVGVFKNCI